MELAGAIPDANLDELVRRIVSALSPRRIYLFGSRARHEATDSSDYDLMVLVDDPARRRSGSREAYQALRGTGIAADVIVWTVEEFESLRSLKSSLPATILREGMLVHAA